MVDVKPQQKLSDKLGIDVADLLAGNCEGIIQLEDAADALLMAHGALGKAFGIYTQAQIDRKIRDERERIPTISEAGVSREVLSYLVDRQVDDLIDAAGLNALQEVIFRLYLTGLDCASMAATLGIKRRAMARRLRVVRRKVGKAYVEGKYAGWYEVYLSEVKRRKK